PEPASRLERVVEQLGRALGVPKNRELDVAEEARGVRTDREIAVAELQRAFEHRDGELELAEPVANLPQAREDPRLSQPPRAFGTGELQRAAVVLLGRLHVRPLAGDVPGASQGVDRTFGERSVAWVEVERGGRPSGGCRTARRRPTGAGAGARAWAGSHRPRHAPSHG